MNDEIRLKRHNYIEISLLAIFIFLACFHIPVIWIGDDSIGLFDLYLIFYLMYILIKTGTRKYSFSKKWRSYFVIVIIYLGYLLLHFPGLNSVYELTLWIKNVEFFIGLFVIALSLNKMIVFKKQMIKIIQIIFLIMMIYQIGYFLGIITYGFAPAYRIGLPLTRGVSSNPAGFILGSFIIFNIEIVFKYYKKNIFSIIVFILACLSILLTISRTNIIALLFTILLIMLYRSLRTEFGFAIILLFVLLTVVGFQLMLQYTPEKSKLWNFLRIVEDPSKLITDSSFIKRYTIHWPKAFNLWLSSVKSIFFGIGFGKVTVVDGTIPRLLCNQGIIGFALFHIVWYFMFIFLFPKNEGLKFLLIFNFINGINGETLIVSFRSVQVYVILIACIIIFHPSYIVSKGNRDTKLIYRNL